MAELETILTERLCGHHIIESFDCGDPWLNRQLHDFQERFENGDRVLGFVACDESREVLGYVILSDTELEVPNHGSIRAFTVPAMAISVLHRRGGDIFHDLVRCGFNAMYVRQVAARNAGSPYRGLICMPGDNKALARFLRLNDFQELGEGLYWIEIPEDMRPPEEEEVDQHDDADDDDAPDQ